MNDMSSVIIPKSDQINADTLLAGPMTVTIREVHISGGQEQPVSIMLDETPLAYRPCKSMSRVLVQAWGPDANKYVGRSLTLYRDPSVKWGGLEVGGIRISHMSHIDGKLQMQLTATKGQRKPHVVMPLVVEQKADKAAEWVAEQIAAVNACADAGGLDALTSKGAKPMGKLQTERPELHAKVLAAYEAKRSSFGSADGDDDVFGNSQAEPATDHSGFITGIKGRIAGAATPEQLAEVETDFAANKAGLPDELVAEVEGEIAEKQAGMGSAE